MLSLGNKYTAPVEIRDKVQYIMDLVCLPGFDPGKIVFRYTSASKNRTNSVTYGNCYFQSDGNCTIGLHPMLFEQGQEHLLKDTTRHEIAHAVVWQLWKLNDHHGYYWGHVVMLMGGDPYDRLSPQKRDALRGWLANSS